MKHTWQLDMRRMKLDNIKLKAPAFFAASGSYEMAVKPYSDKTAAGLATCIIDYLNFMGYPAHKAAKGRRRMHEMKRFDIFSGNLKTVSKAIDWASQNVPEIHAIINRIPVKIEVRTGQSQQTQQTIPVEKDSGLYFIAHGMPSFLIWYEAIIKQLVK